MAARAGRNFEGIRLLQSLQKNRSSQSNPGDPNVPNVHQWDVKRAEVRHWAGLIEAAFEHARFIRQGAGAADDYGARVTAETAERWEGLATAARDEFRSLAACRAAAQLPAYQAASARAAAPHGSSRAAPLAAGQADRAGNAAQLLRLAGLQPDRRSNLSVDGAGARRLPAAACSPQRKAYRRFAARPRERATWLSAARQKCCRAPSLAPPRLGVVTS
jgi:hypothetical protein